MNVCPSFYLVLTVGSCVFTCVLYICVFESAFTYFNDGADASRNEHKQAGLLIKQIEENHNGAETSPEHWKTKHTDTKYSNVSQ